MLNFIRKEVFSGSGFPFDIHIFFLGYTFGTKLKIQTNKKKEQKKREKTNPKKVFSTFFLNGTPSTEKNNEAI